MGSKRRVQQEYQSKTDLVAIAIKEMIHSGELPSGSTLRQRDIGDLLGVSPTPVREALRRLEAEGFVIYSAHRSAVVVRSESATLYENALIRASLEALGTEIASSKAGPEDIASLKELNEQFANSTGEAAVELNREFHFTIYQIASSPVLKSLLNLLWKTLEGGPLVLRPHDESVAQHRAILDAIEAGDHAEAGATVRSHILDAAQSLEA